MAQLTDTLVSGDERVTGMIYGTQAGNYATCTEAGAAKTANIPGFVLTVGVHVRIKFSANNTAATPTLNVSGTGAKSIKVRGNNLAAAGDLAANGIYEFVYDGTNWELTGAVPTSHASSATTYGIGTTSNYGHVKIDNSAPLEIGSNHTDGVSTGNAHYHNGIGSITRTSVTTPDIAHINTDTKAHMVLSQITSSAGTTHDPGDGYVLTFMWDTTTPWDTQLFIPDAISPEADYGRLKFRTRGRASPNTVEWGDWQYLPAASTGTLLTSSNNINNCKGNNIGDIIAYYWLSTSMPTGTLPSSDTFGAMLIVYKTADGDNCIQTCYRAYKGIYQRRLVSGTWGSWEKILVSSDITTGSANGTISVAGTDVAVKGLGGAAYMGTGTSGSTVALGNHTHSQYLPKAGGTMTGGITLPTNFYHKDSKFGIDAKNSDIINANSIYFGDECTDTQEGIHFKRGDSGNTDNYDTFWIDNGKICFVPNHAVSTATSSSSAQIVPRLPNSVSDNQVVLTNGTTGALKTLAASSLSVGTATTATNVSGTQIGQDNSERHLWFSTSVETQRGYIDSLMYRSDINRITANVSGYASGLNRSNIIEHQGNKDTKPLHRIASYPDSFTTTQTAFADNSLILHLFSKGYRYSDYGIVMITVKIPDTVDNTHPPTINVSWKLRSSGISADAVQAVCIFSGGLWHVDVFFRIQHQYQLMVFNKLGTYSTNALGPNGGWALFSSTDSSSSENEIYTDYNGNDNAKASWKLYNLPAYDSVGNQCGDDGIVGTAKAYDTSFTGTHSISSALAAKQNMIGSKGGPSQPVYFDSNGKVQAIPLDSTYTSYLTMNVLNARTAEYATRDQYGNIINLIYATKADLTNYYSKIQSDQLYGKIFESYVPFFSPGNPQDYTTTTTSTLSGDYLIQYKTSGSVYHNSINVLPDFSGGTSEGRVNVPLYKDTTVRDAPTTIIPNSETAGYGIVLQYLYYRKTGNIGTLTGAVCFRPKVYKIVFNGITPDTQLTDSEDWYLLSKSGTKVVGTYKPASHSQVTYKIPIASLGIESSAHGIGVVNITENSNVTARVWCTFENGLLTFTTNATDFTTFTRGKFYGFNVLVNM